ncbi:MAG: hypothetical protein EPO09_00230 [Aquabacterium sp.]|uniref:hypothetical protein n=1 Tax=Aquabacterium sp. TaxID=1872578 RepID=UPI001218E696|nr:hypothetical protein [Aquabacterium sp.]TAL00052.1 MAG: hypothetical protein EPO09_00230 [Aquabacterium sp.]
MDQTRRKLVLASTTVPMALALPGCGGGGSSSDAGSAALAQESGRATAQAVMPTSGGYVDIGNVSGKSIDAIFRSGGTEYLRYFVPVANTTRAQAVLNTSSNTAFVRMTEVIVSSTTPAVTHHRCISLELAAFPAVGANKQYNATTGYKGTLIVNTTTAAAAGANHYEYDLSTGGIKVTHNSTGVMTLEFIGIGLLGLDFVDGVPTTAQTISTSPATTVALKSGSNLAVNPFLLSTASGRGLTVSYISEDGSWI